MAARFGQTIDGPDEGSMWPTGKCQSLEGIEDLDASKPCVVEHGQHG